MRPVYRFGTLILIAGLSGHLNPPVLGQTDPAEFLHQRQSGIIRSIFAEIESSSAEEQLASLRLADLLLAPQEGLREVPGIADAVGANALRILGELTASDDAQVRAAATNLRSHIATQLALGEVASGTARRIDLTDSAYLRQGDYEQWFSVDVEEGLEYRAQTFNCSMVSLVALTSDGQSALGGGTRVGRRFGFVSPISGPAYFRVSTPLCEDGGEIVLSASAPAVAVQSSDSILSAWPAEAGRTYLGSLDDNRLQWYRLPAQAGQRYVLEAVPEGETLDTVLTAYASDGTTELGEDDDGGIGWGSRLELTSNRSDDMLVRVERLGSDRGRYEFRVSLWQPVIDIATPVSLGIASEGRLALATEEWWSFDAEARQRYRIEVSPDDLLDTYLTLYEQDGTTIIDEDDDGGNGLGSRLEFTREVGGTVLMRVGRLDQDVGSYELVVSERMEPLEIAEPAVLGTIYREQLSDDGERWWTLDVPPGSYVLEARPTGGLDTVITLFGPDGTDELASDDDGGDGLGSRLELRTSTATRRLVRVHAYSGSAGEFDFSVLDQPAATRDAATVTPGEPLESSLERGGDQWFRLEASAGSRYTLDAIPLGDLDTVMTLYDGAGLTELDSNDDNGDGLGSRLEYLSDSSQTLLVRVQGFGDSFGDFRLVVSEASQPLVLPFR